MKKIIETHISTDTVTHTEATKAAIGEANTGNTFTRAENHQYILRHIETGEMVVVKKGLTQFCLERGINKNNLREVAEGKNGRTHANLWQARFYNEYK